MPLIGHPRKCERCRDEKPLSALRPPYRVKLLNGPNGERLCQKHHREAWDEYMDVD